MARQNLIESLNSAVEGFIYVLKTQRNMRLHFLVATLILIVGIYINVPKVELLLLLGVICLVLVLEMVNTAVELTIDLIKNVYHPLARVIKDITAGAVFLATVNSMIVGYIIFSRRFTIYIEDGIRNIIQSPWHLTFITFLLVLFLVVAGKVFFHKGTAFRGGMPSGHAAFAFSIWTIIVFLTANGLIMVLSFVMAFLIARHRVKDSIHSFWEVVAGSVFGVLITALVFQLLL
ncbi:MAG: diacylglycerol kinase [Candidatus Omnitrophota bacterium]